MVVAVVRLCGGLIVLGWALLECDVDVWFCL